MWNCEVIKEGRYEKFIIILCLVVKFYLGEYVFLEIVF